MYEIYNADYHESVDGIEIAGSRGRSTGTDVVEEIDDDEEENDE